MPDEQTDETIVDTASAQAQRAADDVVRAALQDAVPSWMLDGHGLMGPPRPADPPRPAPPDAYRGGLIRDEIQN